MSSSARVISSTMSVHEGSAQSFGEAVSNAAVPVNSNSRAHVIPMAVQFVSACDSDVSAEFVSA